MAASSLSSWQSGRGSPISAPVRCGPCWMLEDRQLEHCVGHEAPSTLPVTCAAIQGAAAPGQVAPQREDSGDGAVEMRARTQA